MSRYDGLIIPRSYSEYINKTDAATLQQALQLSGVLSRAVAAGDNKAVTSNAVKGALAKYEVKQNIGFGISKMTYKISFPKGSYLKIITRGCEEVTVYRGTELKAFRNSNSFTKVNSIYYADDYLYVQFDEYAEQIYILTDSVKTIKESTIPTTVENIPITEIATKKDSDYLYNLNTEVKTSKTKNGKPVYRFCIEINDNQNKSLPISGYDEIWLNNSISFLYRKVGNNSYCDSINFYDFENVEGSRFVLRTTQKSYQLLTHNINLTYAFICLEYTK